MICPWEPSAILPNIEAPSPIEGSVIALTNGSDPRVQAICEAAPKFAALLSRFTNAFGQQLAPAVFVVKSGSALSSDALLSFRDIIAMSIIPYCRSLNTVYQNTGRIVYSDWFDIYPWMLGRDNETLVIGTPSVRGMHDVEEFKGQSAPELPLQRVSDFDSPLFAALLSRWKRHYCGKATSKRWSDRALFRSLNMAFHAAGVPAPVGTSIFDLGRSISLWVSAFEILSHPGGNGRAELSTVYPLFERIAYCNEKAGRRRYMAYTNRKPKGGATPQRRPLPCWIYGKLYKARNDFLHGNPVTTKTLSPTGSQSGLFWLAPALYRLGLSSFLRLEADPVAYFHVGEGHSLQAKRRNLDKQSIIERALLRLLDKS
jgi:hypothetical protein